MTVMASPRSFARSSIIVSAGVMAFLFAACGSPSETPIFCDPVLWELEWDVEGLPPANTPPEWMVSREVPFARQDNGGDIHMWLPWDLNQRQAFPIRDGESGRPGAG